MRFTIYSKPVGNNLDFCDDERFELSLIPYIVQYFRSLF